MRTFLLLLALTLFPAWPAAATFSIVAIDPLTGDLGIAVASRYFAVGAVVPWAEAGVGAIATQAGVNVGYGPRGLELLRQGLTAQQVLEKLMAEDTFPRKDARQVAIVDAKGNIAVFTGDAANAWRGDLKGRTWSAQGNILVGQHVVLKINGRDPGRKQRRSFPLVTFAGPLSLRRGATLPRSKPSHRDHRRGVRCRRSGRKI